MSKYKPRRTYDAENDPNVLLFSKIVDVVGAGMGMQLFLCGNGDCGGYITLRVGEIPIRCSKCGEEIDWARLSYYKMCPQCKRQYLSLDSTYCGYHEKKIELKSLD
ncbi:MAG: hypothetical protein EB150_09355 [Nitrososphaeria archaeon]|nr:hypothetical protein [Nitrososphaeria archaeon]NDB52153.1 hypothetical protein [Nitrosopumilaceae archaeon]NDB87986.1 hypothetical protein [Nitrososphaerota archaeon]NDB63349.1 hypothetical protein [Nitrosopumilaceae archaeon]NDB90216.1 hypothetical protein [Nitrososphaerota archaeon]